MNVQFGMTALDVSARLARHAVVTVTVVTIEEMTATDGMTAEMTVTTVGVIDNQVGEELQFNDNRLYSDSETVAAEPIALCPSIPFNQRTTDVQVFGWDVHSSPSVRIIGAVIIRIYLFSLPCWNTRKQGP